MLRPVDRVLRRGVAESWFFLRGLRVLGRPTVELLACATLGATVLHEWGAGADGTAAPPWGRAFFAAYFLLLGELSVPMPANPFAVGVLYLQPLLGVLFLAEGVIKLGFTVFRKEGNREAWVSILARTSRGHIILCGLGTVGFRVLEELVRLGEQVFVVERSPACAFLDRARALGAEIVLGDARTENLLRSLNVDRAHAVVIATDDDMANLEIVMDIREMKVDVPIVLRLFDQRLASKVRHLLGIHFTLSTSMLAAPLFASAALDPAVVGTHRIGEHLLVVVDVTVDPRGRLANRTVGTLRAEHGLTVIGTSLDGTQWQLQPGSEEVVQPGDRLQVMVDGARVGVVRELNAP